MSTQLQLRVHVQHFGGPQQPLFLFSSTALASGLLYMFLKAGTCFAATVLYFFERCYESGGRLFERIFSQMVFTLFIFEAFTGA